MRYKVRVQLISKREKSRNPIRVPLSVAFKQFFATNLQKHAATEIRHVFLREIEALRTPRKGLEELAREHATIIAVLLQGMMLGTRVRTGHTSACELRTFGV